jgi:hypothetical protein
MKFATKILVVVLYAAICATGALLSIKGQPTNSLLKRNAVPIDNRTKQTRVWIWT